jgi:apolipoprotein N-acyltransferase
LRRANPPDLCRYVVPFEKSCVAVHPVSLLLAILSGLLLSALFPPSSFTPAAAVALVPLLRAIQGKHQAEAFRLGFLSGAVYFGTLLWWIAPTIARYGNMPEWAAWPILGLLLCYLALYPGLWCGFVAVCARRGGWAFYLAAPAGWVLLEWVRGHLLSGFPWGSLAYALYTVPPLMQTGELWGPYGLSFLIVLFNVSLWRIGLGLSGGMSGVAPSRRNRRCEWAGLVLLMVGFGGLWAFGKWRIDEISNQDRLLPVFRAVAVQGAVPQERKWDAEFQDATLDIYEQLSLRGIAGIQGRETQGGGPAGSPSILLVWPETAAPFFFQEPGPLRQRVEAVAGELGVPLLFGSPARRFPQAGEVEYLNRAYLLDPSGGVAGTYDKIHLVPFGEYLPWGSMLSWLRDLLPTAGNFTAGASSAPLTLGGIRAGVLICFESIFPSLSRDAVRQGANVLAVITNDAWFGDTGAPYQHEAMAAFRAVETRRWVVRAANTGVSSLISPCGERVSRTSLFEPCYVASTIHLREDNTVFVTHGEYWLLMTCLLFCGVPLVRRRRRQFLNRSKK